jgi:hypothetical protein
LYYYGGDRDCNKFQIYFVEPPSIESDVVVICYHCNTSIIKEEDQRYIIVAAALQRPLYFHEPNCYAEFLEGLILFYNEVIVNEPNSGQEPEQD